MKKLAYGTKDEIDPARVIDELGKPFRPKPEPTVKPQPKPVEDEDENRGRDPFGSDIFKKKKPSSMGIRG